MHSANSFARAVAIVLLAGGVLMAAATPSGDIPPPAHEEHQQTHVGDGYRVYLDEHGKPTVPHPSSLPATASSRAPAPSVRATPPTPELLEIGAPDGKGRGVVLDDRFHMYSVARIGPGGEVVVDCTRADGVKGIAGEGGASDDAAGPTLERCAPTTAQPTR